MAKVIKKCTTCGGTGWVKGPATVIEMVDGEVKRVTRPDLPTIVICPACKGEGNWEVEDEDKGR